MNDTPHTQPRFHWFTAACIVLVLMGLAHGSTHFAPDPTMPDADGETLARLFKTYKYDLLGTKRTFFEVTRGFSWFFTLTSFMSALAGFALLTLRPRPRDAIRRLSYVYTLTVAVALIDSLVFWFVIPTAFLSTILALLAISLWRDGRTPG